MCLHLTLALVAAASATAEPIRFARTPDISPDGQTVAFSYLGDIWTVPATGGVAHLVTMHEAHEIQPAFSPDGKLLAFSSSRFGSYDVFIVPVQGGRPTRLTFDSAADMVAGWSPDGQQVLFASNRGPAFPTGYELYSVPVTGGAERRLPLPEAKDGVWSPRGDWLAFVHGPGLWYRKNYRGSANDDLWLGRSDGSAFRRVTDFPGQDTSPAFSPDGKTLYYVSEVPGGPANVVKAELNPDVNSPTAILGKPTPVTVHKEDAVRRMRLSGNGEWMVYECGPDLFVASTRTGESRKLVIEAYADEKSNSEKPTTYRSNLTGYALSPDERHVVFVAHGELFLSPVGGGKSTRLTDHPAFDHNPVWSPDGKAILFLSDRSGHENIYRLEPDDPEHPDLTKAHKFKVRPLTDTPEAEFGLLFSPDGKRVAFLRSGKLWTMNPDGTDPSTIVAEPRVFDYDWSPDSKWLVYARTDGSFASELYIVPEAGGESRNVTRYATFNGDVSWAAAGGKIGFVSQRRGSSNMYVLRLQKPTAPGAPAAPAGEIDFDDIHLRADRVSATPAEAGTISPDGSRVAFRSTSGGDDLWVATSDGREVTRLTTGGQRPTAIRWARKSPGLIYFLDRTGVLRTARLAGTGTAGTGEPGRVNLSARLTVVRDEEYAEMFDQAWRALKNHFYDPTHHGANWDAIRDRYRPLVAHVGQKEDLYALVFLMLGELNASHLGITGTGTTVEDPTADLGLFFDGSHTGPGLKVAEVLKNGPCDRRGLNIKPGDLITGIDRIELGPLVNVSKLLNGKAGETILLDVTAAGADPKDPKARRRVEVVPAARESLQGLIYDRWVARNSARVDEASGGKLGYIHIPSMDETGLEKFVRALYSDNFDKDGIIIDVRYNGGGFTHDQVLNYLGGKEHTVFRQRDGGSGLVLRSGDRKWTKPAVVLINNRSFSDAEIFPDAFRTLGLGKVVGQATGGLVIGTTSTRLIDGSTFRLPRTGVFTAKGVNMEKEGVQPDVPVELTPDQIARGLDGQLTKAVEVLAVDVEAWKKGKAPSVAESGGP